MRTIIQSYKGHNIIDNGLCISVNAFGEKAEHDFIIDLDDSKMSGNRKSFGMSRDEQITASMNYIDWLTSR